jgi:molybdate transport system permease protein
MTATTSSSTATTTSPRRREVRTSRPPMIAIVVAAIAITFFAAPLVGLLLRAPWGSMWAELSAPETVEALKLSLVCSLAATVLSVVFGIPLAWVLARQDFPGRRAARALVTLPMVLPPVVGGVALFLAFGRRGFIGEPLDDVFGVTLPYTTLGVIVAETFVAMPFFVIAVEAALRSVDRRYEEAATTLGSGRITTFRRVTLPLIGPSLVAGAALSWARALGEFGATITFAGNLPGKTQTMPLAIFLEFENGNTDGAIALSLVLVLISMAVLVGLRDRWLRA